MIHHFTSIYTSALRNIALAYFEITRSFEITCLQLVATYLHAEENLQIVYTVLNQCKAEIEMLLDFSYLLIVQGELCLLD